MTRGLIDDGGQKTISGFELVPPSIMAGTVGMLLFITVMGWWKYAGRRQILGFSVPGPDRWTLASGLCTAGIIVTTTLAYTFDGVSIVFVMLLMRGGVLIIAPVVDYFSKRQTRWFSWAGLLLSMAALVVAFSEEGGYDLTIIVAVDISIYLTAYFIRLQFMSHRAKSADPSANTRYFVEEQMVASPSLLIILAIVALVGGDGAMASEVRAGFTTFWSRDIAMYGVLVGILSQGTGIFGSLIFLDKRENTFCVPVNRSSSILAGVCASFALSAAFDLPLPSTYQLAGAGLIIGAIGFLAVPFLFKKR
ncbi:MAG: hypothetical protein ACI9OJ_003590 [Myxococcota bacterium]